MKTWLRSWAVLTAAVVMVACSQIPVSTDYDPDWRLPPAANYAWIKPKQKLVSDPLVDNDLFARRIQRAVDEQLAAKGLKAVASESQANLLVSYYITHEEKIDITTFRSNFGYYPCWHCWGPGYDTDVYVTEYTAGTLIIDIVDAKSKELVWRGIAERRVPSFKTPQERDAYVRETAAAIFRDFPPGSGAAAQ